jgi:hypothetical protein
MNRYGGPAPSPQTVRKLFWRNGIFKTLKTLKIDGLLLGFAKKFINDCILWVVIGNTMSSFKNIENGVPQGAVLSATLFLVEMAKICDMIEEPTKILMGCKRLGLLYEYKIIQKAGK